MIVLCVVHSTYYLISHLHNVIVFWKTACLQLHAGIHMKDYENTICFKQMWDFMLVYASRICVCEHLADNLFIPSYLVAVLNSCTVHFPLNPAVIFSWGGESV